MRKVSLFVLSPALLAASVVPAAAQSRWFGGLFDWFFQHPGRGGSHGHGPDGPVSSVPEIDASTGLLAMAAVAAALLLAWELRRRRA